MDKWIVESGPSHGPRSSLARRRSVRTYVSYMYVSEILQTLLTEICTSRAREKPFHYSAALSRLSSDSILGLLQPPS